MTTALNTENREYITWQYEQLTFGLLGGLKKRRSGKKEWV